MAVISINTFGGILPAVQERALPPENATTAQNLNPKTADFRPLLDATSYAGVLSVSNPKTIHRLSRTAAGAFNTDLSTGWKAYSAVTQLVKWPQNDNNTERTSVTDGAGGYAPRVIDATGEDRLLGLPRPSKPTLSVNAGTYFTEADRDNAIVQARANIIAAFVSGLARAKVGATYTNNTTEGYLETGAEVSDPPVQTRQRVYAYSAFEGTITDSYIGTAADLEWVRSTRAGEWMQATGTPAWMGTSGTWHYAVKYHAYGAGYKATSATISSALTDLKLPDGVTALLDADQVTELTAKAVALFDPDGSYANPVVQPLRDAVTALEAVLNGRPQGSQTSAAATTAKDDAISAAANAIYDALARQAGYYVVDTGGGGA
jgi:hypothetical protein